MTKEFIKKIKENHQEYILGIYEENRYAWIFDKIIPLDKTIEIKVKLGIWEYNI